MPPDGETHVAYPRLYKAAVAPPPRAIEQSARPFDPDDLPLEMERTEAERELVDAPPPRDPDTSASDPAQAGHVTPPRRLRRLAAGLLRRR